MGLMGAGFDILAFNLHGPRTRHHHLQRWNNKIRTGEDAGRWKAIFTIFGCLEPWNNLQMQLEAREAIARRGGSRPGVLSQMPKNAWHPRNCPKSKKRRGLRRRRSAERWVCVNKIWLGCHYELLLCNYMRCGWMVVTQRPRKASTRVKIPARLPCD